MTDEMLPEERRRLITEWLSERRSLSIGELARRFGVSTMTIHRDVDRLAREGVARKTRGGVLAAEEGADASPWPLGRCAMCGKRVPRRAAWVATPESGEQWQACCPHCGLLQLSHATGRQSALAADFLYGRMVNVYEATFVVGSDVTLCCVPSELCFATRHDAERYRQGFGGELLDFGAALAAVGEAHHRHGSGPSGAMRS